MPTYTLTVPTYLREYFTKQSDGSAAPRITVNAANQEDLVKQLQAFYPDMTVEDLIDPAKMWSMSISSGGHPIDELDEIRWQSDPPSTKDRIAKRKQFLEAALSEYEEMIKGGKRKSISGLLPGQMLEVRNLGGKGSTVLGINRPSDVGGYSSRDPRSWVDWLAETTANLNESQFKARFPQLDVFLKEQNPSYYEQYYGGMSTMNPLYEGDVTDSSMLKNYAEELANAGFPLTEAQQKVLDKYTQMLDTAAIGSGYTENITPEGSTITPDVKMNPDIYTPNEVTKKLSEEEIAAHAFKGDLLNMEQIIDAFKSAFPDEAMTYDEEGVQTLHPYLAQMFALASGQQGFLSSYQLKQIEADMVLQKTQYQFDRQFDIAMQEGITAAQVTSIQAEAQKAIAIANQNIEQARFNAQIAMEETRFELETLRGTNEHAQMMAQLANTAEERRNEFAIAGQRLATEEAIAETGAATTPFGYLDQATTPQGREQRIEDIQKVLAAEGLAGASPFGALAATPFQEGFAPEDPNLRWQTIADIQQAQAATNPFGALQLGQGMEDISTILRGGLTPEEQLAFARSQGNPFGFSPYQQISLQESLARGGLSPQQRLAEIQATGSPQQMANMLNFIGNPAAVGYATQTGMLQDIADSPAGNIPAFAVGLNRPQVPPTASPAPPNPTTAHLADLSASERGFLEGQYAALGKVPDDLYSEAEARTPKGTQPF